MPDPEAELLPFARLKVRIATTNRKRNRTVRNPALWLLGNVLFILALATLRGIAAPKIEPNYDQPWQVVNYAADAGLTRQRVFDIAFTSNNIVWVAAEDGLRRFDGFNWNRFGTNANLPSSFVRAVHVTASDELWVGSDAGAGVFDVQHLKYDARGSTEGMANTDIREIDEDADGTLWFSCDQWPDFQVKPGGLSSLKNGQWRTFKRTNGIPMDYVIGYFKDSKGRQFAMTPHGWAQRDGDQWKSPADPGWETEDCILHMAEAANGTLFAQGEHHLLILKNGRWMAYNGNHPALVCATRDGRMVAVDYDGSRGKLWFCLWDGEQFVRASAPVPCQAGGRFYHLRQAPDGSLWCVGFGAVVRWAFTSGKWTAYPQLPPPVGTDRLGRVWFADNSNVTVYANGQFESLHGKLMALNPSGSAVLLNGSNRFAITDVKNSETLIPMEAGCEVVDDVKPDGANGFWFQGSDGRGNGKIAHYRDGKTAIIRSPYFQNRAIKSAIPASQNTLLLVVQRRDNLQCGLAIVTNDAVEWQSAQSSLPPMTYSSWSGGAGRYWFQGYSGLYEQRIGDTNWQPVKAFPDTGFAVPQQVNSNELLINFSGGPAGHPGCALFASNLWHLVAGDFSHPTFGLDQKTIYLSSHGGVYIRRQPGTLDLDYLSTPEDVFVNITVADVAGDLWLGTSEGVFRYHPTHTPPDTKIVAATTEVRNGGTLPVSLRAMASFEKNSNPAAFRYAWHIDNAPWSPFEPWPELGLSLPHLSPGEHTLEVRARDVDGNVDPVPAKLMFTVLPVPLQQRVWFLPVVILLGTVLSWLGWTRVKQIRQIAIANATLRREIEIRRQTETELEAAQRGLERRVAERTAELTQANASLSREIAERRLAEETKRRLEEQLHQSQKMEAIGTLAGGIAHDFNNILAVIIPYCHLVLEELQERPDLQEQLNEILKAADRAKDLVQQILAFSRRHHHEKQMVELQPVVKETLKLLRSVFPSTLQIVQNIKATSPVLVDPTQIHQVLMNLCVNAQHAMEGKQGRLDVGLDEVMADDDLCARSRDFRPIRYIRLTIRDNGCGMPPEILKRIFEPFFTTKEVGQGTGLGLAVVHGIVKNFDGIILVQSNPGDGTTFEVFLPARDGNITKARDHARQPSKAHGEHVMIVDDENAIVDVLKLLLSKAGFHVTAHHDPQAAFRDFLSRPADIDLILTDLTMPGMTGLEFAKKVYEAHPALPIVLATGYGGDQKSTAQMDNLPNIRRIIEKPIDPEAVLQILVELVSQPGK